MIVYPAIDVRNGKCVRLIKGEFEKESIYGESPVEMAIRWQSEGAEYLHMVDLDGAKEGMSKNLGVVQAVCKTLKIPVQLGGGIRTMDNVEEVLDSGVSRVILGTAAVRDQRFVKEVLNKYGSKIAIGIDAKDGFVAIEGWLETSSFRAVEFGRMMQQLGAGTIIYTDISKDGMLTGPNLGAMEEMAKALDIDVIASGGVAGLSDIEALRSTGVTGVITGKALYIDAFKLGDAIKIGHGAE